MESNDGDWLRRRAENQEMPGELRPEDVKAIMNTPLHLPFRVRADVYYAIKEAEAMKKGYYDLGMQLTPQTEKVFNRIHMVKTLVGETVRTSTVICHPAHPLKESKTCFEYDLERATDDLKGLLAHDYNLNVDASSYYLLEFTDGAPSVEMYKEGHTYDPLHEVLAHFVNLYHGLAEMLEQLRINWRMVMDEFDKPPSEEQQARARALRAALFAEWERGNVPRNVD